VTLLLAINMEGNILDPFVIFHQNTKHNKAVIPMSIIIYQTKADYIETAQFCKWVRSFGKKTTKKFVLVDSSITNKISRNIALQNIDLMFIPDGSACILSPFRKIAPKIVNSINKCFNLDKCRYVTSTRIMEYIHDGIADAKKKYLSLFSRAFSDAKLCKVQQ